MKMNGARSPMHEKYETNINFPKNNLHEINQTLILVFMFVCEVDVSLAMLPVQTRIPDSGIHSIAFLQQLLDEH